MPEKSKTYEKSAPRVYIRTFGCQMNEADSLEVRRHLLRRGGRMAAGPGEADLIVVNTCTVRHHAEERAMSFLGRLAGWRNGSAGRRLIVTGCAAERLGENIRRRLPFVDLVLGAKAQEQAAVILDGFLEDNILCGVHPEPFASIGGRRREWAQDDERKKQERGGTWFDWFQESEEAFPRARAARPAGYPFHLGTAPVSAFVTIMRGCNYSCSYCIVPQVRGREIYRPPETVLREVRDRVAEGAREIMLLGQTVNSYPAFDKLLRAVGEIPGVERIRFVSPHPHYFRLETIRAMAETPAVCPQVHLPAQSGSDRILSRMRRNYTRREYLEMVRALREKIPEISITTDLIVGFCGETEEDFRQTLSLAEEAGFDDAFTFLYSPRPGTEAAGRADDVPPAVKKKRLARLQDLVNRQARESLRRWVGRTPEMLVERGEGRFWTGRIPQGRFVKAVDPTAGGREPPGIGAVARVRITAAEGRTLRGEIA